MASEYFDALHYLRQIGGTTGGLTAWQHFVRQGDALGLDPSPYFSTRFYKQTYANWHAQGLTAFEDFLLRTMRGRLRKPHPLIDPEAYVARYPDLQGEGAAAAVHFMLHGDREGRSPSPDFDADFYRRCYLALGEGRPFRHYVTEGAAQGFLPRPRARDAAASRAAMAKAITDLSHPILLVSHDAQQAGVPILTLDLAQAMRARGLDPVFLLGRAGPLLGDFKAIGPVFVLGEGWDAAGLAAAAAPGTPALINTAAAAEHAAPLARAGLDCRILIHEMPDYLRDQGLLPHLRAARAAGADLIASMPGMAAALAGEFGGLTYLLPGVPLPATPLAAFRAARRRRQDGDGPVFVGAGHADRRKGFDLFLDAAQAISAVEPEARFVWLGALDPWARQLADEAQARGLDLDLPGFVRDSLAWYRAADVYLLTSRQDPGPMTAVHAAAVGTPFVGYAADIGLVGLAEGVGVFAPPGDRSGFVAAALAAAAGSSPNARRRMRRHVRQASDFNRYVDAILRRFHHAADGAA